MVNAQIWLDQNYPQQGTCLQEGDYNFGKRRSEITELDRKLDLDCSDFGNLKTLPIGTESAFQPEQTQSQLEREKYKNEFLTNQLENKIEIPSPNKCQNYV